MFSRVDQRGFTDSICTAVLKRLAGVLTHQAVEVNGVLYPIGEEFSYFFVGIEGFL